MTIDKDQARKVLMSRDPLFFRKELYLDGPNGTVAKWGTFMSEMQINDFKAVDPALKHLAGLAPKPPHQRFFIQRGRGSSKTTDLAATMLWLLVYAPRKLDMVVAAEDRDQALLIREQMLKILQYNDWLYEHIDVQKKLIRNKRTDATLNSLSRDVNSSFGLTPDVFVCDEFTHWTQQSFWSSAFSSFNKTVDRGGILIVACNAGYGMDWKYKVAQMAKTSPLWYYSAPYGHAPWYSQESIDEQRAGLPVSEFRRLWLNEWQASGGEFCSQEEAEACIDFNLLERSGTECDGWQYVAAIDYAEKKDRTVGVVGHLFNGTIVVDRMDVIDPNSIKSGVVRTEWCENWIRNVHEQFGGREGHVSFVVDKWQLLYILQKLTDEGFDIEAFDFASGIGNWELSMILRGLLLHRRVRWYPDCGVVKDQEGRVWHPEDGRNDLVQELIELEVKHIAGGKRWRFDHSPTGHDDRAFALGAMCRHIVLGSGGIEQWAILPSTDGFFRGNTVA